MLNPFTLLVERPDILLVFDDEEDMRTHLATIQHHADIKAMPMYFEDITVGISMGAKYGLRREVARKFANICNYHKVPLPFTSEMIDQIEGFLTLSN